MNYEDARANSLQPAPVNGAFATQNPSIEPTTQALLDTWSAKAQAPLESLSVPLARQRWAKLQAVGGDDQHGTEITEKTIIADGQPIKLVIVRPANTPARLPAFMFFHGGGWVMGNYPGHARLIRDLVLGSGAVAVYVDYSLAPEARYPTAINQGYAATCWVAEQGAQIGVDGTRLAVLGNSVGATLAAAVSLMARQASTPPIRLQALLWPATDARFASASADHLTPGQFLSRSTMRWFWDHYLNRPEQRAEPLASPLRASLEAMKGLPPALVITAENDVLRDEGEAYARRLAAAGVLVTAVRYRGMIHDFAYWNALSKIPGTRSAIAQTTEELKKHLA